MIMKEKLMEIYLTNKVCPECGSKRTIKYVGVFCGVTFGCGACENMWQDNLIETIIDNKNTQQIINGAAYGL